MLKKIKMFEGEKASGIVKTTDGIAEIAATSGGLKALNTFEALNAMEDLRKCCGGNGYLLHSGIGATTLNFTWLVTAEGDYIVMLLLLAKFLLRSAQKVQ